MLFRSHLAIWTTARDVAERIGDVTALVQADISFGDSHATLGDFPTALPYLERAVAPAAQLGDLAAEADAHNSPAWAWEGRRNHHKALDHARATLTGYQAGVEQTSSRSRHAQLRRLVSDQAGPPR